LKVDVAVLYDGEDALPLAERIASRIVGRSVYVDHWASPVVPGISARCLILVIHSESRHYYAGEMPPIPTLLVTIPVDDEESVLQEAVDFARSSAGEPHQLNMRGIVAHSAGEEVRKLRELEDLLADFVVVRVTSLNLDASKVIALRSRVWNAYGRIPILIGDESVVVYLSAWLGIPVVGEDMASGAGATLS